MEMLPDYIEVIISAILFISVVLNGIIQLFSRSPIDRFLLTRQNQVKEEVKEIVLVSLLFVLVIGVLAITDTSFLAILSIDQDFADFLLYVGVFLFLLLFLLSVLTYWIRPTATWQQEIVKTLLVIGYIGVVIPPLLVAGSFDYATLDNRTIVALFIVLWALYAFTFLFMYRTQNYLSPKRISYQIQWIDPSKLNELYMVTALDKEKLILSEDQKDRKNSFFTPFYIYNYVTNTLHKVERADRMSTEIRRKDLSSGK